MGHRSFSKSIGVVRENCSGTVKDSVAAPKRCYASSETSSFHFCFGFVSFDIVCKRFID